MTETVDPRIADMDEQIALPRQNGELLFEAPWEARAFGLAVTLNEQGAYPWSEFSHELAREIAGAESMENSSGYYERWLTALEQLIIDRGLITRQELDRMAVEQARHDAHDHHHDHEHHHEHP